MHNAFYTNLHEKLNKKKNYWKYTKKNAQNNNAKVRTEQGDKEKRVNAVQLKIKTYYEKAIHC